MSKFMQFVRSFGLLIARLALGAILIAHGWNRWSIRKIPTQVTYLQQFHTPYPEIAAWGATILELVGGLFLVVGALTPLVALAVLVEQILIISYTKWSYGPYLMSTDDKYAGGYEYNVALAALALLFVVMGAGGASIDRLFRRSKTTEDDDTATKPPGTTSQTPLPVGATRPL
jgi:putative oxidoreductase